MKREHILGGGFMRKTYCRNGMDTTSIDQSNIILLPRYINAEMPEKQIVYSV